jgi:hypothetical protein
MPSPRAKIGGPQLIPAAMSATQKPTWGLREWQPKGPREGRAALRPFGPSFASSKVLFFSIETTADVD